MANSRQEEEDAAAYFYSLGLLVPFLPGFFEGGLARLNVLVFGLNQLLIALHAGFGLHHLPLQLDLQVHGLPQRLLAVGAELLLRRQMVHQAHGSAVEQLAARFRLFQFRLESRRLLGGEGGRVRNGRLAHGRDIELHCEGRKAGKNNVFKLHHFNLL